jgi:hypothetical protein
MKLRILSLAGALALSFLAATGPAPASSCTTYCANARQTCLSGCPCAEFTCDTSTCQASCVCPIVCFPTG